MVLAWAESKKCWHMFISIFDAYVSNIVIICTVVNGVYIVYDDKYHDNGDIAMPDKEWADRVKGILKAELKRRNVGYRQLAERLEEMGVHESERNINNKISRGGFSAVFLIQCLRAAGCHSLNLED